VSDFLARVAARAVGEAPLAQPRLPALFEPGAPGLDIVDTEAVTHAPSEQLTAVRRHATSETHTHRAPETDDRRMPAASPEPVEAMPLMREAPRAVPTLPALGGERDAPVPESTPVASPEPPVPLSLADAVARVTAPAVPAAPARQETEVRVAAAHTASAQVHDEPPAVRVHIGRLEVRANLQNAAPPPQPRPADARPQGLSLADYLRGKRVAG
jgi:hypothetical protein